MIGRRVRHAVAVLLVLAAAGCGTPATPFPDPPAVLAPIDDYPWGDTVAQADGRLARHVAARFGGDYGPAREDHYVAPSTAALVELRAWYAHALGPRWQAVRWSPSRGEDGFAFTSGRQALAVGWLPPQADGRVPVTLFRFGDPAAR